ncbi:MAG: SprT family zinc-dependent metalloprotease [Xanthomonadales bacterium]|jgi:predicted metal-dependent hydrolase|nr:SprT family zinc-dependent metalloprotease [Xanthomonadales bacterium]
MGRWLKHKNSIFHDGHELPYELVRRPRVTRNVHLELAECGGLRVVAPKHMNERAVRKSLQARSGRVMQFLSRQRQAQRDRPGFRYVNGESHLYLGKGYPLEVRVGGATQAVPFFDGKSIAVKVRDPGPDRVREALRRGYRQQAEAYFSQRLEHFCKAAPWTSGKVAPLGLRQMKRTMGSCSRSGRITMNPHLVKAPPFLADYVVAHEVCHLQEHNHGKGFYRLMEQLYPAWREARARLKAEWQMYRAD